VILDTLDPVYAAAGIRTYPMQSAERYQVFIEHMVPDATNAICGLEGGLKPGEQRRVPYDANAACSRGCSAITLPVDNRHAGWESTSRGTAQPQDRTIWRVGRYS
jgi:hypothetical protein